MSVNLLEVSINFIDFAVEKIDARSLNWIGKIIQWLIEGVGIVGLGIILFTLILKTITLPLDVYSRVKMKKQSLIMKAMRPQMEKLQKQYANDKAMYSQKVMELQKANGISMFGACLPMIVTLIIFMVVFSAFSTYSQYANLTSYNNMVEAYNASVQNYVISADNTDGFLEECEDISVEGGISYRVNFDEFKKKAQKDGAELKADFDNLLESDKIEIVRGFVRENARRAAADYYRAHRNNFLWVGNLWYPDSLLNKEVPNFSKFSSAISRAVGSGISAVYEDSYNEVTWCLRTGDYHEGKLEGKTYNGYFVLIVLAIGLMLLQQFITMRSQKDANELGTVDGSGARTNKMMLIMMPIIYGIFSFFYSAAFSIYMITNTLYGLVSMLIINKIMDVSFAKQEANGGFKIKSKQNNRKRLK